MGGWFIYPCPHLSVPTWGVYAVRDLCFSWLKLEYVVGVSSLLAKMSRTELFQGKTTNGRNVLWPKHLRTELQLGKRNSWWSLRYVVWMAFNRVDWKSKSRSVLGPKGKGPNKYTGSGVMGFYLWARVFLVMSGEVSCFNDSITLVAEMSKAETDQTEMTKNRNILGPKQY